MSAVVYAFKVRIERTASGNEKNSRIREFLFPAHPLLIPCSDFPEKRKFSAKAPHNRALSKEKFRSMEEIPCIFPC
jgi:hypothetical protein